MKSKPLYCKTRTRMQRQCNIKIFLPNKFLFAKFAITE